MSVRTLRSTWPERRATWVVSAVLVVAVLSLFGRSAGYDFVSIDDPLYVTENRYVARGLTADGLWWALTTYHAANWFPLTWVSLMADTTIYGPGPLGPHVTNTLLHATSTVLLFVTLQCATGRLGPSALAAALFAIHPLRAESVAWITERKDVLSGLFWMATLLAYQWYSRQPTARRFVLVVGTFALGLTAKATLVTLPLVLLLLDVWPLNRWRTRWWQTEASGSTGTSPFPAQSFVRLAVEKVPLLVLASAASALTVAAERFGLGWRDVATMSVPWRIVNALTAYVVYIRKTIWPSDLAVFYPHPGLLHAGLSGADVARAVGAAGFLLAVTAAVVIAARSRPVFAVGWFWYLGTLVPVLGLVQVGEQAFADRFSYIPSIGLYLMTAWGLATAVERHPRARSAVVALTAAALTALGTVTWFQIATWRDSNTLFTHALAVTRDNYFAHASLGRSLSDEGRLDEAAVQFERSLAIKPDFVFAHLNYGIVLQRQGKLDEAAAHELRAIQLSPTLARAHTNLGVVRYLQGQPQLAIAEFEQALRLDPTSSFTQANLGNVLLSVERYAEAIPHLQDAARFEPSSAELHYNLGLALLRQQRFGEAVQMFEQALRLKPGYVNAQRGLDQASEAIPR